MSSPTGWPPGREPAVTQLSRNHSPDRLALLLLLALAVHASVILGVGFARELRHYAPPRLEITLAQHRDSQPPEQADFLAQANQQGSGTLEEARALTATEQAPLPDLSLQPTQPLPQAAGAEAAAAPPVTSRHSPERTAPVSASRDSGHQDPGEAELRSQEIASLEAQLDAQRQAYAKRPRIRRLTSVATRQADDAQYLHNWRQRVEAVGNRHYPKEARAHNLHGELRMMVALLPNGSIHEIKVLKSSGSSVLDRAALRILRLAAPFDPFPETLRHSVDVLEIIRTWRFHEDRMTSSS